DAIKQGKQAVYDKPRDLQTRFQYFMELDPKTGQIVPGAPRNLNSMTPQEVFDLKKEIGEEIRWVPEMMTYSEEGATRELLNAPLRKAYGNLKEKLNAELESSSVAELNERWADLYAAEKAITQVEALHQKLLMFGVPDLVMSGLAGTMAGVGYGPQAGLEAGA